MRTAEDQTGSDGMEQGTTRRDVLRGSFAAAVGALLMGGRAEAQEPRQIQDEKATGKARSLRIAHLTDMHIQPERAADQGVAACFKHVQAMADKPSLILTGGDTIMDGFEQDEARTKLQWDLWDRVTKQECGIPVVSALGNHDIWGWNKKKSSTKGDEALWGKRWACERFGRERAYTSFDNSGWHFVVLDSVRPDKDDANGYEAFLEDEQFDWLSADLAATTKPTLIVSHVPILSATVFDGMKPNKKGNYEISGGLMHNDFARLGALFLKHRHVKACLSGHIHLVDRVDFNGVQYFCNGAVSGGWWKGPNRTCEPGYAVLDLFSDGTLTNTYVPYGWTAKD